MSQAISQANVHANPQANMQASSQAHQLIVERREWADRHYYTVRDDSSAEGVVVYPFPIDEMECERLDMLHCLIHDHALEGRSYMSDLRPTSRRQKVLDVGCGTGIYCYEVARSNPNLDVVGIDLFDMVPGRMPQNTRIVTPIDFNLPSWPFAAREFDLIRNAGLSGSVQDWGSHIRKCYHYLRSGGFWESLEIDWMPQIRQDYRPTPEEIAEVGSEERWWQRTMHEIGPVQRWSECMQDASRRLGKPLGYPGNMQHLLEAEGFDRFIHKVDRLHLKPQIIDEFGVRRYADNDSAECSIENLVKCSMFQMEERTERGQTYSYAPVLEGLSMYLLTQCCEPRWDPASVRELCLDVAKTCYSKRRPVYFNLHIITARKP